MRNSRQSSNHSTKCSSNEIYYVIRYYYVKLQRAILQFKFLNKVHWNTIKSQQAEKVYVILCNNSNLQFEEPQIKSSLRSDRPCLIGPVIVRFVHLSPRCKQIFVLSRIIPLFQSDILFLFPRRCFAWLSQFHISARPSHPLAGLRHPRGSGWVNP